MILQRVEGKILCRTETRDKISYAGVTNSTGYQVLGETIHPHSFFMDFLCFDIAICGFVRQRSIYDSSKVSGFPRRNSDVPTVDGMNDLRGVEQRTVRMNVDSCPFVLHQNFQEANTIFRKDVDGPSFRVVAKVLVCSDKIRVFQSPAFTEPKTTGKTEDM